MTSCSGSGNCVCSCDSFSCSCTNNDKLPSEPTGVSINQQQYENIKDLAKLLYFSDDSNANRAYVHLSEMIQSLKDKDHEIFHKEKESYFGALSNISSNSFKGKLNSFFKGIGVKDRV